MSEKIKFILSKAWDFLAPFIRVLLTQAGMILAEAAMEAVKQVETTMGDSDGAAKRAAAFAMIQSSLKTKGVQLAASVINMAIEAAVNRMKG
ncbi:MAG: phage holin, LLH family [Chloroflexota bacterium]